MEMAPYRGLVEKAPVTYSCLGGVELAMWTPAQLEEMTGHLAVMVQMGTVVWVQPLLDLSTVQAGLRPMVRLVLLVPMVLVAVVVALVPVENHKVRVAKITLVVLVAVVVPVVALVKVV